MSKMKQEDHEIFIECNLLLIKTVMKSKSIFSKNEDVNNNAVAIESNKGPEFQGKNLWRQ